MRPITLARPAVRPNTAAAVPAAPPVPPAVRPARRYGHAGILQEPRHAVLPLVRFLDQARASERDGVLSGVLS
jgi:hypothetical protein